MSFHCLFPRNYKLILPCICLRRGTRTWYTPQNREKKNIKIVKVLGLSWITIRQMPVVSHACMHSMFCCVDLKRRTKESALYLGQSSFRTSARGKANPTNICSEFQQCLQYIQERYSNISEHSVCYGPTAGRNTAEVHVYTNLSFTLLKLSALGHHQVVRHDQGN